MRIGNGLSVVSVLGLALLVGCGSGSLSTINSGNPSPTPTPAVTLTSISVSPSVSSLGIGATQQLKATGKYSDGSSKDLTSTVTWSSSSSTVASVNATGMVLGLKSGNITISATQKKISGSLSLSIVAILQTIAVTPMGPGIVVGANQVFTATGSYNDGSVRDISKTVTWSSSNFATATVTAGGKATGVAAGTVTVTATASSITGTAVLNVVSHPYVPFVGPYAFTLVATDSRGPAFFAGSLNADGNGHITGVEDSNTAQGVLPGVAITGTYTTYPDGRGTLSLGPNQSHPNGLTLRFAMSAGGTSGSVIEFDGKGILKGNLSQQTSSAFSAASFNGTYVFRTIGVDSGVTAPNTTGVPQPVGQVGIITVDGSGNVTDGNEDINDDGDVTPFIQLNSSTYSVDATTGRGTLQLVNSSATSTFAFYVLDSSRINLLQIDSAPASATAGVAELQTVASYSPATLNGSYSFLLDRPAVTVSGTNFTFADYEQIGFYSFDGSANVIGTRDWESATGTFAVTSTGHGTLSTTVNGTAPGNQDIRNYSFYLVSPSKMYLLQTGSLPAAAAYSAEAGEANIQIDTPYAESSLHGAYVLESYNLATDATALMLLQYDGAGHISGLADIAENGTIHTIQVGPALFNLQQNSGFIQVTIGVNGTPVTYDLFLTSTQHAWVGAAVPPLDGSLTLQ